MKAGCVVEKNTGLRVDPRYVSTGLYLEQGTVYSQNGVLDILYDQPDYSSAGGPTQLVMQDYHYQAWNRATIGWSLECEAQGKTREEGLFAASQDLDPLDKDQQFKSLGISLLCITCFAFVAQLSFLWKKAAKPTAPLLICVRLSNVVMFPMIGNDVFKSADRTNENIAKLSNYSALNECTDQYVFVDTDTIRSQLEDTQSEQDFIKIWFFISVGLMLFEIVLCIGGGLALVCGKMHSGKSGDRQMKVALYDEYE